MRVFRDQTSLSATPELWGSIEASLAQSEFFLLMASPDASSSQWVGQEVAWWLANRNVEKMLLVLSEGELVWEDGKGDFDWDRSTSVPDALRGRFSAEPLWVDLRWARTETDLSLRHSKFRAAVLDVAAPLHGKPKDELDGEDVRQHRRFRLAAWTAGILLAALTVAASFSAYRAIENAKEAQRQQRVAVSRQLAAQSSSLVETRFDLGLLLAVQASREASTVDARRSLLGALTRARSPTTFLRQGSDRARALAFSNDGAMIAAAYGQSGVVLWNTRTHRSTPIPLSPGLDIQDLSFSADVRWLSIVDRNGSVVRWDVASGRTGPTRDAGHEGLWPPAFSADGTRMVVGRPSDDPIVVWDLDAGAPLPAAVDVSGVGVLTSVALDAAGTRIAVGSEWGNGFIWDIARGAPVLKLYVDDEVDITALAFSPDGRRLAYGSRRGDLLLASLPGGDEQRLPRQRRRLVDLRFGPAARHLASRDEDGRVVLWDVSLDVPEGRAIGDSGVSSLAFAPDGATLAMVERGGAIALWDLDGTTALRATAVGDDDRWVSIAFGARGETLFAVRGDGAIVRIDTSTWTPDETQWLHDGARIRGTAAAADGSVLVAVKEAGGVELLDQRSGARLDTLKQPEATPPPTSAGGSPGLRPEVALAALRPPDASRGTRLALSPGNRWLATEGTPGTFVLWDLETKSARTLPIPTARLGFPARPAGRLRFVFGASDLLATAHAAPGSASLMLWDTISGAPLGDPLVRPPMFKRAVKSAAEYLAEGGALAVSPDRRQLAAGSFGDRMKLWDLAAPDATPEILEGTIREATGAAYSPDGETLAAGDTDGRIVLWDVGTHRRIGVLVAGFVAEVLAFSPDGRWLAVLGAAGRLAIWPASAEAWRDRACAVASRNLTASEWNEYMGPERACESTCSGQPPACAAAFPEP